MKYFIALTIFTLIFPTPSAHALGVEKIFGNDNPPFIQDYNRRLFNWFVSNQSSIQKCLTKSDQLQALKILKYWRTWGEEYIATEKNTPTLIFLNFEIFYEQKGEHSKLLPGFRMRLPQKGVFQYRHLRSGSDIWGFEVRTKADASCQIQMIKLQNHKDGSQLLHFVNGEEILLRPAGTTKLKALIEDIVWNTFPIYLNQKLSDEILFLESFNLILLNRSFVPVALSHEKEFHQPLLRLRWKNENEFTVYYP